MTERGTLEVPDEEAVKEWRDVACALGDMLPLADHIGYGFLVAVLDARERVEMALERVEAKVREDSG
jgi:hypothetical protein